MHQRNRFRLRITLCVLLFSGLFSGCAGAQDGRQPSNNSSAQVADNAANNAEMKRRMEVAQHVWQMKKIFNYAYVIEKECQLCDPPARVTVKNGKCTRVESIERAFMDMSCKEQTVPELFSYVAKWIEDDSGSSIEATFNKEYGYPVKVFIQTNFPHETESYVIRKFRVTN